MPKIDWHADCYVANTMPKKKIVDCHFVRGAAHLPFCHAPIRGRWESYAFGLLSTRLYTIGEPLHQKAHRIAS